MTELHQALNERFGENSVKELVPYGSQALLLITLDRGSELRVLVTNGLSDYEMPVPEKMKSARFNELYFCIPSYWELEDRDNPRTNWVFHWLERLSVYVREKNTWFGHGHTMPCGKEANSLSETMKQNHFFLSSPMLLEKELETLQLGDKSVNFLAVVPIFEDEMDYKSGKGTLKLQQKLINRGVSEKLDDYRRSALKSNWRWNR